MQFLKTLFCLNHTRGHYSWHRSGAGQGRRAFARGLILIMLITLANPTGLACVALQAEEAVATDVETERYNEMPGSKNPAISHAFFNGDETGSSRFRMPFCVHTKAGTLIAGTDANFGSGGDSAENIDIAIRRKPAAVDANGSGETWEPAFIPDAMHMQDYADEEGYRQKSASFIDAAIVEDRLGRGRILLLADAWAWNGGLFQHLSDENGPAKMRSVARGDGFCCISGRKYLLLSDQNIKGDANGEKGNINQNTDRRAFRYAADIYGPKDEQELYPIYHLNGVPRPYRSDRRPVDDSNLSLGEPSAYSLNEDYELFCNGEPLYVRQHAVNGEAQATDVDVPMKIFYEDSELQLYNTSYIMQFYSDDDGRSWHTDRLISGMFKREEAGYYILGPGRGIQIQAGAYAGRLIIPVYYKSRTMLSSSAEVIYSDDGGATWTHGESIPSLLGLSEGTVVEMPDHSLRIFVRNTSIMGGTVIEATSFDGGESWQDVRSTFPNHSAGINCQMSAIALNNPVRSRKDGKDYPAIALSCPNLKNRTHGRLFTGLIKERKEQNGTSTYIDWEYSVDITAPGTLFAYSCLSQAENETISILYESSPSDSWDEGLKRIYYREFELSDLHD